MAANLQEAQSAVKLCEIHESKELTSFCRTCKIPICTQCVKSVHMQHDWDNINTVAKERRAILPALCRKIKSENLNKFRKQLGKSGAPDEEDSNTRKIIARKTALIENINMLASKKIELSKKRRSFRPQEQKEGEQSLTYLEKMTTELDINVGTFSDFDVLEMEQEMTKELESLQSLHINDTNEQMVFIPGEMNPNLLDEMYGQIHYPSGIEVNRINAFTFADLNRNGICAMKEHKAWFPNGDSTTLYLMRVEGKIFKKQKLNPYNFVVSDNAEFYYTDIENEAVKVLTNGGKNRLLQKTSPLLPTCINLTNDEKILVTLRDAGDKLKLTKKSRRIVQKLSREGELLQSFEFAEDGKTRLFKWPYRTEENKNQDICTINWLSENTGELVVLKLDGRVRFKYQGLSNSDDFYPRDVACDSEKRILVANYTDKSIQVLAYDGTFIKYLLQNLNSEPWTMSLHEDDLWLVCGDKSIHVYSFKSKAVMQ